MRAKAYDPALPFDERVRRHFARLAIPARLLHSPGYLVLCGDDDPEAERLREADQKREP